jgi:chromate transporter
MLWELFVTFLKIGCVSFGGGYAMIPVIEHEAAAHGWISTAEFSELIAIAGMAPGPIGLNSAVFVGYHLAGFPGAVVSLTGMVLPSLLVAFSLSAVLARFREHPVYKGVFHSLRPVITGMILFAAYRFAVSNFSGTNVGHELWALVLIFAGSLMALVRFRMHPALVIVGAGALGTLFLRG